LLFLLATSAEARLKGKQQDHDVENVEEPFDEWVEDSSQERELPYWGKGFYDYGLIGKVLIWKGVVGMGIICKGYYVGKAPVSSALPQTHQWRWHRWSRRLQAKGWSLVRDFLLEKDISAVLSFMEKAQALEEKVLWLEKATVEKDLWLERVLLLEKVFTDSVVSWTKKNESNLVHYLYLHAYSLSKAVSKLKILMNIFVFETSHQNFDQEPSVIFFS